MLTGNNKLGLSFFGEPASEFCGCVLHGVPAGTSIDFAQLQNELNRYSEYAEYIFMRPFEKIDCRIVSGVKDNTATGAPVAIVVKNQKVNLQEGILRPSTGDYGLYCAAGEYADIRGGGHSAMNSLNCYCAAGSIAKQLLESKGLYISSHLLSVGNINDLSLDSGRINIDQLPEIKERPLPVIDSEIISYICKTASSCERSGDTLGGVIECFVMRLPAGLGGAFERSVQSAVAAKIFSLPNIGGLEFGTGFAGTKLTGKKVVDTLGFSNGGIRPETNMGGGLDGQYTNGLPFVIRVAVNPSSETGKERDTIDYKQIESTKVYGRAEVCAPIKLISAVEGAVSLAFAEMINE